MEATPAPISALADVFGNLVSAILGFAGITLFILLTVGGFKYITSGGDPKAVEGAKKTLTYAIGGLIALLLSYLILVLIREITGANITEFNVVLPR